MKILRCVPADADEIKALEDDCISLPWSRADVENALVSESYALFKAVSDEKIVGYGGVQIVLDEGGVTNLAVRKEFRRLGAGSALLSEIIAHCARNAVKTLRLEVAAVNDAAKNLYLKYGFEVEYTRKNYYPEGDALVMVKRL